MGKGIIYDEIDFNRCPCADKVRLILGDDFEIKVEGGKTFVVRKKPQYPKSYCECCDILQLEHTFELKDLTVDEEKLMDSFIRLMRCRDAYWKIAGEQMGLGKPWEPDWSVESKIKYVILYKNNNISKDAIVCRNTILAFPTEEMRNAFYEYFKDLIEACKTFL